MNHPADHYFTRQDCGEYEPILSIKNLAEGYEANDSIEEEEINCDSCIYFNSYECKIFK
jgi:hypothetical protein